MKSEESISEIKSVLKSVNVSWSSGKPEELNNYFHDDIVILSPELKILGAGKADCIQSYVDFLDRSRVIEYTDTDPEIRIFEDTAIAFYNYKVSWKTGETLFNEAGQELYVFAKQNGKWLVVMRELAPKE